MTRKHRLCAAFVLLLGLAAQGCGSSASSPTHENEAGAGGSAGGNAAQPTEPAAPAKAFLVPGGTFPMGRGMADDYDFTGELIPLAPTEPEHLATVSAFYLDEHELTVARFRAFLGSFDGTTLAAGAGAHPLIEDSGWNPAWVDGRSFSARDVIAEMHRSAFGMTWTDQPGANEQLPITGITWLTAFQFCVWDRGRLPTEAEWEFAAAGGEENRLFPWGTEPPTIELANFGNLIGHDVPVGSLAGVGRWGQSDLAGGVFEWVLDAHDTAQAPNWYAQPCDNCANVLGLRVRVMKGGSLRSGASSLRPAARGILDRESWDVDLGVRCARDMPRTP